MTTEQKLERIKILAPDIISQISDERITAYLDMSRDEIISWRYSYNPDDTITDVPAEYETVQIFAVLTGLNLIGAEGEISHAENGISRTFNYAGMVEYIRSKVIPKVKIV